MHVGFTEIPIWLPYANLALNLLILPLLKVLWDIRMELVNINGRMAALTQRVDRIDHRHDAIDNGLRRRRDDFAADGHSH